MLKSLHDLRSLRVLILHPKDRDAEELAAHIRRIGCQVETLWPPSEEIPLRAQIVFFLFRQEFIDSAMLKMLADRASQITLIGIVEAESPFLIDALARAGTLAVVTKPIRAFGLLTSIVLAHSLTSRNKVSSERISKLEARLTNLKRIERAKSILMARNGVTEEEAYESIRRRAMAKRVSMENICLSIIEANEVFGP